MIIAIDGPAGSGKTTLAKLLSQRLRFRHIETGSMYRSVALMAQRRGVALDDVERIVDIACGLDFEFVPGADGQKLLVCGEDVTPFLKSEVISLAAARVATYAGVRETLTGKQRLMGQEGNVVMEGRDIGTDVFPNAQRKFFIYADPQERGRRRYEEIRLKDPTVSLDAIVDDVKKRDEEDRNRAVSPLRCAEDAVSIDTTGQSIEEVLDEMVRLIEPSSTNSIQERK